MEFLTRKIGPLPTWAWAALIVGGFVVYRLRKQSQTQPNVMQGGQLNPENNPGYPGNGALSPSSLVPVSAIPQTNGGSTTAAISVPDTGVTFQSPGASGPSTTYHGGIPLFHSPGSTAPTAGSGPGGQGVALNSPVLQQARAF